VMSGSGPTIVALCSFASAETVTEAVEGAFVVDAPLRPPAPGRIGGTEQSGVV
jgi:4-diphosphocytidyl-2C-methyl-D-erythritol kinase